MPASEVGGFAPPLLASRNGSVQGGGLTIQGAAVLSSCFCRDRVTDDTSLGAYDQWIV